MILKPEMRLIHLQLTRNCNLRCSFCGQWGEHGYMKKGLQTELSTEEWMRVISDAVEYRDKSGIPPRFIIWGGEPLISKSFTKVLRYLKEEAFELELVTNGILLEDFAGLINDTVKTVYVSLDGPQEVHEKLRGEKGIFPEILRGVESLDTEKLELVNLFTICGENYKYAVDFPFFLAEKGFSRIIMQNLIYCSPADAKAYTAWLKDSFAQDTPSLESWINDDFGHWTNELPEVIAAIKENIIKGAYGLEVELFPHELNEKNIKDWFKPKTNLKWDSSPCSMPYRHLHVNADGQVHFCVDFSDFSLGNVRKNKLSELFFSEKAEKFRAEYAKSNTLCGRCPWFYNKSLND